MPQFFAPIIAGLRFPGKSRGIGRMQGEVRTGSGWVRWCAAERLHTGLVEWEESAGQCSGTPVIPRRVVFWRTPADWGNAGECEAGVAGCGGMRRRGCIQAWWAGRVGGGILARLRSWGRWFSGGLRRTEECGEREPGVVRRSGVRWRGCMYTGLVEWGESAGRRSGTPAILGRVVLWWTPVDWGNVGSVRRGGWVWWYAAERLYTGLVGPGEWGRQTGRAEQGGMAYSPCRASKKHPHQRVLSAVRLF